MCRCPPEPTPNIEATVEARIAEERAVDATTEARIAQEQAVDATAEAKIAQERVASVAQERAVNATTEAKIARKQALDATKAAIAQPPTYVFVTPSARVVVPTLPPRPPAPTLSRSLLLGLFREYASDKSNPGWKCMTYQPGISLHKQRDWLTVDGFEPFSIALKPDIVLHYTGHTGKWIGRLTGDRCKGLESWEIDDATGAIKYLGSSTSP